MLTNLYSAFSEREKARNIEMFSAAGIHGRSNLLFCRFPSVHLLHYSKRQKEKIALQVQVFITFDFFFRFCVKMLYYLIFRQALLSIKIIKKTNFKIFTILNVSYLFKPFFYLTVLLFILNLSVKCIKK